MTDKELKHHVQSALDWDPSLDAADIGVSVDEAVVTLRGNVGSPRNARSGCTVTSESTPRVFTRAFTRPQFLTPFVNSSVSRCSV